MRSTRALKALLATSALSLVATGCRQGSKLYDAYEDAHIVQIRHASVPLLQALSSLSIPPPFYRFF